MLNKIVNHLKSRGNLLFLLISFISIIFITSNLLGFSLLLKANNLDLLILSFQILVVLSTIFTILFLPTYPLFFILVKEESLNSIEKLSFTIILNLVYYILTGYIGFFLGIPLSGGFFLTITTITYLCFILIIIILELRGRNYHLFNRIKNPLVQDEFKTGNYLNLVKKNIKNHINTILLLIFLFLISLLYTVKYDFFFGRDAWFHVYLINIITHYNILPLGEYFSAVGLQLFGAIIHFFSGIDTIFIPRYFLFYTFFVSALIYYNLLMKIFKNKNLAILGVFILESSSIGFCYTMYQFWPTNLTSILCLTIFYLLYRRLETFSKLERPLKSIILKNMSFTYLLVILIFTCSLLIHSLNTIIMILAIMFVYVLYFLKDYRRGVDFLLLCLLLGIFLVLSNLGLSEHFFLIENLTIPLSFLIIGGIGALLILFRLSKTLHFTSGRYNMVIQGKKIKYYKKIEDKIIFPLIFGSLSITLVIFFLLNFLILDISISKVFVVLEMILLIIMSIWGLILFQKKPRGKSLFLWILGYGIVYLVGAYSDFISSRGFFSSRILLYMAPVIVIGFISYMYKLIKLQSIREIKYAILIISFIIFSFFAHFYDDLVDIDTLEYSATNMEVNSIQWHLRYTSEKDVIIAEFGIPYIYMYYGYPYDTMNYNIYGNQIEYFINNYGDYFPPEYHIDEYGINKLLVLKNEYNTTVFLILDANYELLWGWDPIQRLSENQIEEYYNLPYLNRIFSSISESGQVIPYYSVI